VARSNERSRSPSRVLKAKRSAVALASLSMPAIAVAQPDFFQGKQIRLVIGAFPGVTGGGRGIGRAIVEEFAGAGHAVAFTYTQNQAAAPHLHAAYSTSPGTTT